MDRNRKADNLSTGIDSVDIDKKMDDPSIGTNIIDVNNRLDIFGTNIDITNANIDRRADLGLDTNIIDTKKDGKVDNLGIRTVNVNRGTDNLSKNIGIVDINK